VLGSRLQRHTGRFVGGQRVKLSSEFHALLPVPRYQLSAIEHQLLLCLRPLLLNRLDPRR
jgi:hypothetical protein